MLNDLQTLIEARLGTVPGLVSIGPALRDAPPKRPSALVWLAEDREVTDQDPAVIRELVWCIEIAVDHSETVGAAQAAAHDLLDGLRAAFSGWVPDPETVVGIQKGMKLKTIKLAGFRDHGVTSYVADLVFRVFPGNFRTIP